MISDQLAGARIAITGSTGFVGTALVERLLRSVPDCELVLLVRPSKRHDPAERVRREIFKNNAFDRLKAELQGTDESFERDGRPPRSGDRRRRQHRRPRVERRRPGHVRQLHHRHPLGCGRGVRLAARLGRRDQPARPHAHRRHAERARHHTAPRLGQHLLRRRQPPRQRTRATGERRSVRSRTQLAQGGRCSSTTAQRPRGRQPRPRPVARVPCVGTEGARRRRSAGTGGEDRAAPRTMGERPARRSGPSPRRQRRMARRLRVHQGTGRAGAHRGEGRGAGQHRPAVDHRVGVGRTVPRLDPRVPHGRAGHPQLRPGPAEGVPGRARGHGRRHPGRPGGRVDHRRRRSRPRARAGDHAGRQRWHQPVALPVAGRQHPRLVQRAPPVRRRGPTDRRARVGLPRPRSGAEAAEASEGAGRDQRAGAAGAAAARQAGVVGGEARGEEGRDRPRATSTSQLYGLYTECEAIYQVDHLLRTWDTLSPADQAAFNFDPRSIDWVDVHHHDPPAVDRAALTREDHAGQEPQRPRRPAAARRAVARPPRRRVRPREHAHLVERRRELLVAGDAAAEHARTRALRAAHAGRGARRCRASTARTAATSCATSTAATRTRPSPRSTRTRRSCSPS